MSNRSTYDPLITVDYEEVTVRDPELLKRLRDIGEFYLSISVDDAFYEMRKAAGLDTKNGKSLINGKSWFKYGGIVLGQWLQAFCRFYRATGDERFRQLASDYVGALLQVQKRIPDCCICNTAYMAEKLFHGLMDACELCGIAEAYPLCRTLMDMFRQIPAIANAQCRLGDNGSQDETFREIEWYTLSEALYRFADMAIDHGEPEDYVASIERFAKKFEYKEFWDIFLKGENLFEYSPKAGVNTEYFHAYSHVNSFNSAAYLYHRTGDEKYLTAAKRFKAFMDKTQVVATGGYGTMLEWLLPQNRIVDALLHCHCTFENQCNTYASLRLNRFLTAATGDIRYGHGSELLYYNSFLASLETDKTGHTYYYSDYCADGGSKWLNTISWTCCTGTRPLVATELLKNIYFRGRDGSLYVNLFIASQIECENAVVTVSGNYIKDGSVAVLCTPKAGAAAGQTVHIRKPDYIKVPPVITGVAYMQDERQYHLFFEPGTEQTAYLRFSLPVYEKDIMDKTLGARAFLHGPLVLAAEGIERRPTPSARELTAADCGCFTARGERFRPFMDYTQNEEYRMHFVLEEEI